MIIGIFFLFIILICIADNAPRDRTPTLEERELDEFL